VIVVVINHKDESGTNSRMLVHMSSTSAGQT